MKVHVWLHRLDRDRATGATQSKIARQLLALACQHSGITIDQQHLGLPGIELMAHLQHTQGIILSISHCRSLVATALSRSALGIDCEVVGRRRNWQAIADSYFSPTEAQQLRLQSPHNIQTSFMQHWVLKEAFLKANRGSVFGDLNALTVAGNFSRVELERRFSKDAQWWAWRGVFAQCQLGICANSHTRPELTFFESAAPTEGDYRPCPEHVLGEFLPTYLTN